MNARKLQSLAKRRDPDPRLGSKRDGDFTIATNFRVPKDVIAEVQRFTRFQVFTQRELAEMFDLSIPTISKIQRILTRRVK